MAEPTIRMPLPGAVSEPSTGPHRSDRRVGGSDVLAALNPLDHPVCHGPEVPEGSRAHHDPLDGSCSRLTPSTFGEALAYFGDATIDLLHIDGYHTYEAVKQDFESWLPKLSERGVVLFHDVNVRDRDFGVWRLWDELRERYPSFTFNHGHGLGVLGVGHNPPDLVRPLFRASAAEARCLASFFFE